MECNQLSLTALHQNQKMFYWFALDSEALTNIGARFQHKNDR